RARPAHLRDRAGRAAEDDDRQVPGGRVIGNTCPTSGPARSPRRRMAGDLLVGVHSGAVHTDRAMYGPVRSRAGAATAATSLEGAVDSWAKGRDARIPLRCVRWNFGGGPWLTGTIHVAVALVEPRQPRYNACARRGDAAPADDHAAREELVEVSGTDRPRAAAQPARSA